MIPFSSKQPSTQRLTYYSKNEILKKIQNSGLTIDSSFVVIEPSPDGIDRITVLAKKI